MEPNDFYASELRQEQFGQVETVGRYTAKTFLWMFFGLAVTFAVAIMGYATDLVYLMLVSVPGIHVGLLVAELVVVLVLSARVHKISVTAARGLFIAYAVLNGVVFSVYFYLFDMMSLILVFGATSLYFGAMALFGYTTKLDLSRLRTVLVGGLIFLIIMGVASLFIPWMETLDRIVCLVGIVIFLAFTAYDTQKIKTYHAAFSGDPAMLAKASIISALELYLDFVNLFLYLLRFLGRRKN